MVLYLSVNYLIDVGGVGDVGVVNVGSVVIDVGNADVVGGIGVVIDVNEVGVEGGSGVATASIPAQQFYKEQQRW